MGDEARLDTTAQVRSRTFNYSDTVARLPWLGCRGAWCFFLESSEREEQKADSILRWMGVGNAAQRMGLGGWGAGQAVVGGRVGLFVVGVEVTGNQDQDCDWDQKDVLVSRVFIIKPSAPSETKMNCCQPASRTAPADRPPLACTQKHRA